MNVTRRSFLLGAASAGTAAVAVAQTPVIDLSGLLRPAQDPLGNARVVDVRNFGARGDGRSNDCEAIQAAIDLVSRSGGGTVRFPAGTYVASRAAGSAVAITLRSGVILEGVGSASILKLQDGSGGHLVNVTRERNCGVRNMVLDGNRKRQPSTGHGFRSGGVDGLRLENVLVVNAFHYGIGLQGGANRNVSISNIVVEDCGGDGIDIKNKTNGDSLVIIDNVTVRRWGLRSEKRAQAAIDCRGRVRLSNVRVAEPGADDAVGIRMRHGEPGDPNGLGAHGTQLTDFEIHMDSGRGQVGLAVASRDVSASNGSVQGGRRGLVIQDDRFRGSAISVTGCSDVGVLIDARNGSLSGDRTMLSKCRIADCGGNGIEIEADNVELVECISVGNGESGLLIKETAAGVSVAGGDYSRNRRARIVDRGKNSRIAATAG